MYDSDLIFFLIESAPKESDNHIKPSNHQISVKSLHPSPLFIVGLVKTQQGSVRHKKFIAIFEDTSRKKKKTPPSPLELVICSFPIYIYQENSHPQKKNRSPPHVFSHVPFTLVSITPPQITEPPRVTGHLCV